MITWVKLINTATNTIYISKSAKESFDYECSFWIINGVGQLPDEKNFIFFYFFIAEDRQKGNLFVSYQSFSVKQVLPFNSTCKNQTYIWSKTVEMTTTRFLVFISISQAEDVYFFFVYTIKPGAILKFPLNNSIWLK